MRPFADGDLPSPRGTQTGNAIHGTYEQRNLGRAVSHGCVRLSVKNAATLWNLVKQEKMASANSVAVTDFYSAVVLRPHGPAGLNVGYLRRRKQPQRPSTMAKCSSILMWTVGAAVFVLSICKAPARDLGQWERVDPAQRKWFDGLMQPDHPTGDAVDWPMLIGPTAMK